MKRSILGSLALCAAFAAAPFVTFAQDAGPGGKPPVVEPPARGGVNDPLKTPTPAPDAPPAPLNEAAAVNDLEGKQAPELSLQDLYGQTHSLAMHRGQVVVLHWIDPTKCEGDAKQGADKQGAQAPTGTLDRQGPAWNDPRGTGARTDRTKTDANRTGATADADKVGADKAGDHQKAKELMERYKAQGVKFLFVVSFDGTKKDGTTTTPGGTGADKGLNHEQGNPNTGAQGDKNDKPIEGTAPQGGRQTATGQQGNAQPAHTPGGTSAPGGARQTTPPVGIDDDELARDKGQADRAFVLHLDRQQVVDASADMQSKLGPEFPILLDDGGLVAARYHVTSAPYAFIIDRQGKIAFSGTCEGKGDKEQAMREFERELNDVVRGLSVPASAPRDGAVIDRKTDLDRKDDLDGREKGDAGRVGEGLPDNAPHDVTPRIEEDEPNDE
jgi:peroxiredoxin